MRTVRLNSKGASVAYLHERLNRHGWGPLKISEKFGTITESVVVQFQTANDLDDDGVVGPLTWAALLVEARACPPEAVLNDGRSRGQLDAPDPACGMAVDAALDDLGRREDPDGSNRGPEIGHLVDGYAEHWGIKGRDSFAWCAIACCVWTARGLGLGGRGDEIDWTRHPLGAWIGRVASVEEVARSQSRFHEKPQTYPVGAWYTMGRGGSSSDPSTTLGDGHCGIVVEDLGDRVACVDGNVGNAVQRRERPKADLRGYVRWW